MFSAFEIDQLVQAQLMKTDFLMDIKLGSTMTDMYSRCRQIEDARLVLITCPQRMCFHGLL